MPVYQDLHGMSEDDRIAYMVRVALNHPNSLVGVVTENEPGKAARYIKKIRNKSQFITIVKQIEECPLSGMVTIQISYQPQTGN